MTQLLDPKLDYTFKQIFGIEESKPQLLSLLNAILKGEPTIKDLVLKNTEINKILEDDKTVRLDIRARANDDTEIDIEI